MDYAHVGPPCYAHRIITNTQEGVAAIARDENAVACPVKVGDIFASGTHGQWVQAMQIDQRKPNVWSVLVIPMRELDRDGFSWEEDGPERWTSVKVVNGKSNISLLDPL